MTHQVLARKWRPRDFASVAGQQHVVRALEHALREQRLHHAYLFTGTRGVGKTTLARILAKALNCIGPDGQGGITPTPCNQCRVCQAIDAGRFVDYIELDAASNRGVDEMTQLLERAAYAPVDARFKVYMIDEVHMLTSHAFNAMLKTLEEPPDYVKFVLATTDPQKIPVTVLSRCLQFSLKPMQPALIAGELARILAAEGLAGEASALDALGRAARGSMRDALSLTDQAIAFGGGAVTQENVRAMLGSIDAAAVARLVDALAAGDGAGLLAQADAMAAEGLSFGQALRDLAALLHRIALAQQVELPADGSAESAAVAALADRLAPEEVQVYYQIALHGREELHLAPDEYAGFTMSLLRMLAFRPETGAAAAPPRSAALKTPAPPRLAVPASTGARAPTGAGAPPHPAAAVAASPPDRISEPPAPRVAAPAPAGRRHDLAADPVPPAAAPAFDGDWPALAARLQEEGLGGLPGQLALRSELLSCDDDVFRLRVPIRSLLDGAAVERLGAALSGHFGRKVRVSPEVGVAQGVTAAQRAQAAQEQRLRDAAESIRADPVVRELTETFGAQVDPASVQPAGNA